MLVTKVDGAVFCVSEVAAGKGTVRPNKKAVAHCVAEVAAAATVPRTSKLVQGAHFTTKIKVANKVPTARCCDCTAFHPHSSYSFAALLNEFFAAATAK